MIETLRLRISSGLQRARTSVVFTSGMWYVLGKVIAAGLFFVSMPLFSRLLSPEDYGSAALFATWTALFSILLPLNLHSTVQRGKLDFPGEEYEKFLSSITALAGFSVGITAAFSLLLPPSIVTNLFGLSVRLYFFAVFMSFCNLIVEITTARWAMEFQFRKHFFLSLTLTICGIVFGVLGILYLDPDRASGRIIGSCAASILVAVIWGVRIFYRGRTGYNWKYWKYALEYSLPLILHSISGIILAQSGRVMVDRLVGRAATGLFSFGCTVGAMINMLFTGTNTAWAPWFYETMNRGDIPLIQKRMKLYLSCFTVLTISLIVASPWLIRILAPPKFWESAQIAPVIMGGEYFSLLYSFFGLIELYEKRNWYFSLGTTASGLINIGSNLILIPRYGYHVAAWTTVLANASLFLFHWFIAAKVLKREIFDVRLCFLGGILVIISAFIASLL